jgi:hypothetical protein
MSVTKYYPSHATLPPVSEAFAGLMATPLRFRVQELSGGYTGFRSGTEAGMASSEVAALITDATPYITAALTAYGTTVLTKVRDDVADATVGVGRRLLQRIFGRLREGEPLPARLVEVVGAPGDADALGALRLAIRRELEADAAMLADVRQILVSGQAAVHAPVIHSGRDTYYSGRDMTINRPE